MDAKYNAISTPWLHQDTTTIALYGTYEDKPKAPEAPRPAYGQSKDSRDNLKQVLLSPGGAVLEVSLYVFQLA